MKTMLLPVCEGCKRPIPRPEDGFIVEGTVYSADADMSTKRRGLVGAAPPMPDEEASASTAFCRACFYKALDITFPHNP